ncbi:lipid-A-disaccharide synthase [Variovorax sp.]|jgi:lipid-A-disaccharide synthase|uniref:lipid-A-disaccharide synthase n=1 Tax=Variovorax sp. TaxID=1871043 RepID=UPI000C3640DB|nr:lipid-A-disaccharide synthase [Variovorax sp.]MBS76784.1 lipid-A-disaccharide synthase [Variovorax sp.]
MQKDAQRPEPRRFALVAGEASGDLLAGLLLDGLRARWPDLQTAGIGGPRMLAHGFESWWPQEKLAVRGYIEVLRHYAEIAGIRRQLKARLLREWPELFIGVDAPDFNLDLEAGLRGRGMKTVHFVCPSIWAWRPERIEKIRAAADHVLCIFPFEPELLASQGVQASYVGHPLANVIPMTVDRAAVRASLGLAPDAQVVALLPGSRRSEVRYLAARFFEAAALMRKARPALRFVAPILPGLRAEVEALLKASGLGDAVTLLDGQSHAALSACDVTLIASGTATLEAALFKRPMVIAYNMNSLSWRMMQRKQLQPWVGLPNILCRDFVVPELLQEAASPEALAQATLEWLDAPERVRALEARFAELHVQLQRDTPTLCADAIQKVLEG